MFGRVRKSLLCTAVLAAMLTGAVAPTASVAASTPSYTFLTAKQVPTSKYYKKWYETKVISGLRTTDPYCWQKPMPRSSLKHRSIFNDNESNYIEQYAMRTSSEKAAKALVAKIQKCWPAKAAPSTDPDSGKATMKHYGKYSVKDGLWIGHEQSCGSKVYPDAVQMYAIGREGRDVMYMHFWPGRDSCSAPKDMWIALSKKALKQL